MNEDATNSEHEIRPPEPPIWQKVAKDVALIQIEQEAVGLQEKSGQLYQLGNEMSDYYWNTGIPYFTSTLPSDSKRLSFAWNRPTDYEGVRSKVTRRLKMQKSPRFINDERVPFESKEPSGAEGIQIGLYKGEQYLVAAGDHVISPGFEEITPEGGNKFKVRSGSFVEDAHLLSEKEKEHVLSRRKEHDQLHEELYGEEPTVSEKVRDIQKELALRTLALYGIKEDQIRTDEAVNAVGMWFVYQGTRIRLDFNGEHLGVMTWDSSLPTDQVFEIWGRYEDEIRPEGVQLAILNDYLDSNSNSSLFKGHENAVRANMDNFALETHGFMKRLYNFQKNNNFRSFTLETPHVTWSLPIAISLATAPIDEVYKVISPFGSQGRGHLHISKPGKFDANREGRKAEWELDEQGDIRVSNT